MHKIRQTSVKIVQKSNLRQQKFLKSLEMAPRTASRTALAVPVDDLRQFWVSAEALEYIQDKCLGSAKGWDACEAIAFQGTLTPPEQLLSHIP